MNKIGEVFKVNGKLVKVVKMVKDSKEECIKCFFFEHPECYYQNCMAGTRSDETDVIFKKLSLLEKLRYKLFKTK